MIKVSRKKKSGLPVMAMYLYIYRYIHEDSVHSWSHVC